MNHYWNLFLATGMPEAWVMSRRAGDDPMEDMAEQAWPLAAVGDPVRPSAVKAAGDASMAANLEAMGGAH